MSGGNDYDSELDGELEEADEGASIFDPIDKDLFNLNPKVSLIGSYVRYGEEDYTTSATIGYFENHDIPLTLYGAEDIEKVRDFLDYVLDKVGENEDER